MLIAYFIISFILLITSMAITCAGFNDATGEHGPDSEGKVILRYLSICTFVGWTVALLWPVILVSIVPVLFIYGVWAGIKALKARSLEY